MCVFVFLATLSISPPLSSQRINCSVASLHSHAVVQQQQQQAPSDSSSSSSSSTSSSTSESSGGFLQTDYRQEDKWTFLTEGRARNIPVSPFFAGDQVDTLVLKVRQAGRQAGRQAVKGHILTAAPVHPPYAAHK